MRQLSSSSLSRKPYETETASLHRWNNGMTAPSTISDQRWRELTERKERGDRCWMKHELVKMQFRILGLTTDQPEARLALNEEAILKELLRAM
jgi:hypothetical protein